MSILNYAQMENPSTKTFPSRYSSKLSSWHYINTTTSSLPAPVANIFPAFSLTVLRCHIHSYHQVLFLFNSSYPTSSFVHLSVIASFIASKHRTVKLTYLSSTLLPVSSTCRLNTSTPFSPLLMRSSPDDSWEDFFLFQFLRLSRSNQTSWLSIQLLQLSHSK